MLETAMLLLGLAGLAVPLLGFGFINWLIILFEINAGLDHLPADPLRVLNPLDVAILVLAAVTFLGLWPALHNRVWMGIAVALPLLGIVVLLVTQLAGRSALMGAGLIVALLMLANRSFRPLAYVGVLANTLLLIGDVVTRGIRIPVAAAVVGLGYALLVCWFFLIGLRLLGWERLKLGVVY